MKNAQDILREELSLRTASNTAYSLRAFARDLGISPQQLSNVINGRRGIGAAQAERIAAKLDLSPSQKTFFLESLKANFSLSKSQRTIAQEKIKDLVKEFKTKHLEFDLFHTISHWHHFALIELIKIKNANKKPREKSIAWYAKKLGISENEVSIALGRLERLELISKVNHSWEVNQDTVISDHGISPQSVKNYHKQMLEKAIQAMTFQASSERYGSSSMFPVKVKSVSKVKKMIQDFRLAIEQEISDREDAEEVYGLTIQFFRLTNETSDERKK